MKIKNSNKDKCKNNHLHSTKPKNTKPANNGPGFFSNTSQNTSIWFLPVGCEII